MKYQVKYKLNTQLFFRTLKNVIGDGLVEENKQLRYFILEDETRVEIPVTAVFIFSKDRFLSIKKHMENEAGQQININR